MTCIRCQAFRLKYTARFLVEAYKHPGPLRLTERLRRAVKFADALCDELERRHGCRQPLKEQP